MGFDIAALAALAGKALVAAATTDAWKGVRLKVARLFGRGKPDQRIEQRLDDTYAQVASSPAGELQRVQAELARDWTVRLRDLLADHPDAVADVAALVKELGPRTVIATEGSMAAGRDVQVMADRGGVAAGVIHGDVTPPGPPVPGPASG